MTSLHPKAALSKVKNKRLLIDEVGDLRKRQRVIEQDLRKLQDKISKEAIPVTCELHEELSSFFTKAEAVQGGLQPFMKTFWQEQTKAFQMSNKGKNHLCIKPVLKGHDNIHI